eukprot:30864-Pelagococcus_subviridis.AAC.22
MTLFLRRRCRASSVRLDRALLALEPRAPRRLRGDQLRDALRRLLAHRVQRRPLRVPVPLEQPLQRELGAVPKDVQLRVEGPYERTSGWSSKASGVELKGVEVCRD